MKKVTKEKLVKNLNNNKGDYNSMVSIAALYKKIYGEFPKIGLSGQQAAFADFLMDSMPVSDLEAFEFRHALSKSKKS